MNFVAVLLSIILLAGYFYVIFRFTKELRIAFKEHKNKIFRITYAVCLLLPGILLMLVLKGEKFIYFWDFSGYWHKAIDFTALFFDKPFTAVSNVYHSINGDEYNILPNVLLAPVNRLLGLEFYQYAFSIYLIYFVPFALVLSSLMIRIHPEISANLKLAIPFFIICFAPCLSPIRYGFVDVIGLVYIACILSLLVRTNYLSTLKIKESAIIGVLLLLLIFSRRWYAFWFVSFFFGVFGLNAINALIQKNFKIIINASINLFVAGIIPMAVMLIFFYHYFEMTVLKDYTDIYSAYRGAGAKDQLLSFVRFFGLFILAIAGLGLVLSARKDRSLTIFFVISSVIIIFWFTSVNNFGGKQHFYLLVPVLLILFLKSVIYLSGKKYTATAFFSLLLINSVFVFGINPTENNLLVFAKENGAAQYRSDYSSIENIANRVIQLQDQGNLVYCLASGEKLNEDIVKNIKLPDTHNPVYKMLQAQHIDKRDRFPIELFLANYVITTTPTELTVGADNQRIVSYFSDAIMGGFLKDHYEEVEVYPLLGDTKAHLMKKKKSLTNAEVEIMHNYFKGVYPEYEQMYAINKLIVKTSNVSIGDNYGLVKFLSDETIDICPGPIRPSELTFMLDENDKELSFTATFNNKDVLKTECNSAKDGEVYLTIREGDEVIDKVYITHEKDIPYKLELTGRKQITLSVDKGKNEDYCDWFHLFDVKIN